ncbi:MAG TPA: DUF4214 domain-containing protein [Bryobacteraceae bacterium]|nr:DUF4214 domain-containing protein [Bryobacteraceae bacterium]
MASGTYPHLVVSGLAGTASAWITITGPDSGAPAVIQGSACCNTVEIVNSSFVAIKNLQIDSLGMAGLFGVSAKGGTGNLVHDILLEGNTFVGQTGSQQTDGISTKTPTWGWIIRGNTITGAGTGLYLGNSDGTDPFIGGLIENNLIQNTIGYDAEIKFQTPRPSVTGMPTGQSVTIIRNNVFIKNDQASPDGNRPNLLVGGFPSTGAGSTDWYEVYGNLFIHNPREALFQASGRVTIHDNVFVDGQYTALRLQSQDLPLQTAYVYNNTIYSSKIGISFGNAASVDDSVTGNLVFAATPIAGPIAHLSNNTVDTLINAVLYVTAPSFTPGAMNFYPLTGECQGAAIDLSKFAFDTDSGVDFNGTLKTAATGAVAFRGAYAGQGINPGWALQDGIKPSLASAVVPTSCTLNLTATATNLPATGTSTPASCPDPNQSACGFLPEVPLSFTVLPSATCGAWTATSSNPAFLQVISGGGGNGTGSVSFRALVNTHAAQRNATITVASGTASAAYTVTQAGSPDSLTYREVFALYEQLLGRDPDASGFAFWNGMGGMGVGQTADSFLTSAEAFGSDFAVMAAYQAALGTPPTYAQFTGAVAAIRAGSQTVSGLFSSLITANYTAANLYQNLLNRQPLTNESSAANAAGLPAWFLTLIGYPAGATIDAANNEFQSTGSYRTDHTNALYVQMLYFVILNRDPDQSGLSFWLGVANGGGAGVLFQGAPGFNTRIQLLGTGTTNEGLIGSPEFQGMFGN